MLRLLEDRDDRDGPGQTTGDDEDTEPKRAGPFMVGSCFREASDHRASGERPSQISIADRPMA